MKLEEKSRIIKTNVTDKKSFSIENNPAAFRILTTNLYKYPIRAIIRELSCNAIDANKMSGEPLNDWEIHMPTKSESFFFVSDKGPGLSFDSIMNLYTTFFKSTKNDTNEYTGMFGLGSKTPFAYTNQFTIESIYNGEKSIYSAYFDDNGIPAITCLNKSPTDIHTGLKIMFFVNQDDIDSFLKELVFCAAGWNTLPHILGINSEKLDEIKKINKDYRNTYVKYNYVIPRNSYESGKIFVEMGNVLYNLDISSIDTLYSDYIDSIMSAYNTLYVGNPDIVIHLPIGTVAITPSREELHYTDATKEAINRWIVNAYIEFIINVYKENGSSFRNKSNFFYNFSDTFGFSYFNNTKNDNNNFIYPTTEYLLTKENLENFKNLCIESKKYIANFDNLKNIDSYMVFVSKVGYSYSYSYKSLYDDKLDGHNYAFKKVMLDTDCNQIFLIPATDEVISHININKPVSSYIKNRINVIISKYASSVKFGLNKMIVIFFKEEHIDDFKKYINKNIISNFDALLSRKKVETNSTKLDKSKVYTMVFNKDKFIFDDFKEDYIYNLNNVIKENNVKHTYIVPGRVICKRTAEIYPVAYDSIKNEKVSFSSVRRCQFCSIFDSSFSSLGNCLAIIAPPDVLRKANFNGIPYENNKEFVLKYLDDSYKEIIANMNTISLGYFRHYTANVWEYYDLYDWSKKENIFSMLADSTRKSIGKRFINNDENEEPTNRPYWYSWSKSFTKSEEAYKKRIDDMSKQIYKIKETRIAYLKTLRDKLLKDCPMLSYVFDDYTFQEKSTYTINNISEKNFIKIIDYVALCYGIPKK